MCINGAFLSLPSMHTKSACNLTHCYDVIFPETQFVVIVSLEIEQSLCTSPPVARYNKEVLVILLVTLHGVVRSQVLRKNKTKQTWRYMAFSSKSSHSQMA